MKISVLGGGIAGLVAAYNLSLNPAAHVSLYEASSRFGGWIQTRQAENGAKFELGPHSLRCVGNNGIRLLELVDEIALNSQVLSVTKDHAAAKVRYIGLEGKLVALPSSLTTAIKHDKMGAFVKAAVKDLVSKGRYSANDESVHMFFTRRFGREIADLISDPMCRGISASDSRTLGVSAMFPQLVKGEYERRSIIKSMYHNKVNVPEFVGNNNEFAMKAKLDGWRMLNFKHGMEQLPRAILNILRDSSNVDIYENSPVEHISVRNPEVTVTVKDGKARHFDHVVSAIPSFALANALQDEEIGKRLSEINFVDVAHVSLEFKDISFDLEAFGCLIPSYENPAVLGIIFDSVIFPENDTTEYKSNRLSLMIGGEWFEKYFGDPKTCDRDLIRTMALDTIKKYLGITAEPSQCHVDILEKCIPHYTVGHRNRVKHLFRLIKEENLRLSLIGNSYSGAGIPDCIANAIDHTEPLHEIMNERYYGYNPALEEEIITPETDFMANYKEWREYRRERGM